MDVPKLTDKELVDKYGFCRRDPYGAYVFKLEGGNRYLKVSSFPGNCGYGVIYDFEAMSFLSEENLKKCIFGAIAVYRMYGYAHNPGMFIATLPLVGGKMPDKYIGLAEVLASISCLIIKTKNSNYQNHDEIMYFIKDPSIHYDIPIPNIEIISHKV